MPNKPASTSTKVKPVAKSAAKGPKSAPAKPAAKKNPKKPATTTQPSKSKGPVAKPVKSANGTTSAFIQRQKQRLLALRDSMLDTMSGVARDTLRSRAEGSEASAFGMHQADAGSDAYDRDFALSLLSQEQDALYEIDEAIKRIELGTYGICEMSGKPIPHARLEAIPFARFTVECQAQIEKQRKQTRSRVPVTSLFGLTDEESAESEEDDTLSEAKE